MSGAPTFTVVVPAFNAERTLPCALRSVLRQTRDDFELVVVDDGSTDRTSAVVRGFSDPRVRLVRQSNTGLPGARNAGIAVARGALVSFLDADDLWMPRYLERMGHALEREPGAALAYCDAWVFQEGTGRVRRQSFFDRRHPGIPPPADPHEFLLLHLRDNFFYVGTTVRRAVLSEVGPFRVDMTSLEDYELWLRIEASGHRVVEVAEQLALYRSSPGQMSKDAVRMSRNLLRLLDILEQRPDLPAGAAELIAIRRADAEQRLTAATRPLSLPGVRRRLRRVGGETRHLLPGLGPWRSTPPPEVRTTFRDLHAC